MRLVAWLEVNSKTALELGVKGKGQRVAPNANQLPSNLIMMKCTKWRGDVVGGRVIDP